MVYFIEIFLSGVFWADVLVFMLHEHLKNYIGFEMLVADMLLG